ncbi:MAG: hypothetical protein BEN18_07045 [Epulopiscium sp. Nuni2H_MBin001]|nr:MAG: hypothetical protein BEN18_07045 [Epulopiscium sp. Nuni2H_MBin001]
MIIDRIALPKQAYIGQILLKDWFCTNANLGKIHTDILSLEVERIHLYYNLNNHSMDIQPYRNNIHCYDAIQVLGIDITNAKKFREVAEVVFNAIALPVILQVHCKGHYMLAVAFKEYSEITQLYFSNWIDSSNISLEAESFLDEIKKHSMIAENLYELYLAIASFITEFNSNSSDSVCN